MVSKRPVSTTSMCASLDAGMGEPLDIEEEILRARTGGDPNFRLSDYFDLIGGTSTGSIIAAGLSLGMTAEEVRNHYFTLGNATFKRDLLRIGAIRQKYDSENVARSSPSSTTCGKARRRRPCSR